MTEKLLGVSPPSKEPSQCYLVRSRRDRCAFLSSEPIVLRTPRLAPKASGQRSRCGTLRRWWCQRLVRWIPVLFAVNWRMRLFPRAGRSGIREVHWVDQLEGWNGARPVLRDRGQCPASLSGDWSGLCGENAHRRYAVHFKKLLPDTAVTGLGQLFGDPRSGREAGFASGLARSR